MCDFIGYEIKDRLRTKKLTEQEALEEETELEKTEQEPITVTQ